MEARGYSASHISLPPFLPSSLPSSFPPSYRGSQRPCPAMGSPGRAHRLHHLCEGGGPGVFQRVVRRTEEGAISSCVWKERAGKMAYGCGLFLSGRQVNTRV